MVRTYKGVYFFSLAFRIKVDKMRKEMRNIFARLVLAFSVLTAAVSCEHKELCYYHPHTAPVRVNVDWSLFPMDTPTGMTAFAFPFMYDDDRLFKFITHNIYSITLDLEAGFFNTLVFNQDQYEYGTIEFFNLDNYNEAEARIVPTKATNWYTTKLPDTKVYSEPEWLAVGSVENIEVTEEMVKIAEEEFLANRKPQITRASKTINDLATVYPISVTKQIEFKILCEGLYNLRSVRASIDGLAEGCILYSRETTSGKVTHTIEEWEVNEFPDDIVSGYLESKLCTFGIPAGHNGNPAENLLSVHLLLVDNKTVLDYDYPIGDILAQFNELDGMDGQIQKVVVELVIPERLPDVEPAGGGASGGFDIGVDDWGDEIVTHFPII